MRILGKGYFVTQDADDSFISIRFRRGTGLVTILRRVRRIFKSMGWKVDSLEDLGTREVSRKCFEGEKGRSPCLIWDVRFRRRENGVYNCDNPDA